MFIYNTYNFGQRHTFGITFELSPDPEVYFGIWLHGHFCYWINGKCLDDLYYGWNLGNDILYDLEEIYKKKSFQCSKEVFDADAQTLLHVRDSDIDNDVNDVVKENCFGFIGTCDFWDRFEISFIVATFDELILYFEHEDKGRFILGKYDEEKDYYILQSEFFLDAGEVVPVIKEAYEWLEARTQQEIAAENERKAREKVEDENGGT